LQSVINGRHMQMRDIIIHPYRYSSLYLSMHPGRHLHPQCCMQSGRAEPIKGMMTMTFDSSWLSRVVPPRGLSTRTVPFSCISSGQNPSTYVCFDKIVGACSPCNHTHGHGRFRVPPLKVAVISRIALDNTRLDPVYEK